MRWIANRGLWWVIIGFLITISAARAQIIVLPFEDLSRGLNGINIEIAKTVADYLSEEGFQVIYPEEVIPELARLRVKSPGWVDRVVARELFKRFEAKYILLGTVLEMNREEPLLGLSVRILRTEDFRLIWGGTVSFSGKDWHPFLGLKEITFEDFLHQACERLFAGLKEELGIQAMPPPAVAVDEILLRPRSVQGGKRVECAVRLRISGPSPQKLGIDLGDRFVPLFKQGAYYLAFWKAPQEEGRYPVNLVIRWEKGWHIEKKIFLATYHVDNTSPVIDLRIYRVHKTPEALAFKNYVELRPILKNSDTVARWLLQLFPEKGDRPLISEEGLGRLPPRFIWRGTDASGRPLPAGFYRVRLKVWDQAGNSSWKETRLLYVNAPPKTQVKAIKDGDKLKISFRIFFHPVPLRRWSLEIMDNKGQVIKELVGQGPVDKELVFKKVSLPLHYSLTLRDILGNQIVLRNQKLVPIVMQAKKEKKKPKKAEEWVSEF